MLKKKKRKNFGLPHPLSLHTSQLPTGKAQELFLCWHLQLLISLVWADLMYPRLICFGELWPGLITYLCFFKLIFFNTRNILYWGIAAEQCCDGFRGTMKGLSQTYTCIHSFHLQMKELNPIEVNLFPKIAR